MITCSDCPLAKQNKACIRLEIFGEIGCESYKKAVADANITPIIHKLKMEPSNWPLSCDYRIPIEPEGCGCGQPPKTAICLANNEKVTDIDCNNCDLFDMTKKREKCSTCPFLSDERECWAQTQSIRTCRQTNKDDIYNEDVIRLIIHNTEHPSATKILNNVFKAATKFAWSGGKFASRALQQERLSVCEACEFYDEGRCKACGCFVKAKVSMESEKCPKEKW